MPHGEVTFSRSTHPSDHFEFDLLAKGDEELKDVGGNSHSGND